MKEIKARDKISNLLLLNSGSWLTLQKMKGYIDSLVLENEQFESVVETMQKRIDELEAERKQIKSVVDLNYKTSLPMMLLNEILNHN